MLPKTELIKILDLEKEFVYIRDEDGIRFIDSQNGVVYRPIAILNQPDPFDLNFSLIKQQNNGK